MYLPSKYLEEQVDCTYTPLTCTVKKTDYLLSLVPFTTVSCEFVERNLCELGDPYGSSGDPFSHILVFGCAVPFFSKLPTESTEDKSVSVTPTDVQL
jgi:hypothetical protein